MSNLINFNFENNQVRTALKGNEPYFCLKDVTDILAIKNTSDVANKQLDTTGIAKIQITDSLNRQQLATFINEPNLYRVIFRSNKAEAVKFQNWVFDEVLPTIRKTGQYRHTITDNQAYQIQKAIKQKCQHNKLHYQTVYHSLYAKFGVKSYKDILASDFEQALAFIAAFALGDETDHNAFWRMVGILEYDRISQELRQLQDTLDVAQRQLNHINRTKGLLYDSLGEQRLPTKAPVVDEARKFIEKQMAFKKRIGLIT